MDRFEPTSAFEGWVKAKIENLEGLFKNHLRHHEALERKLYLLVGLGFLAGILISRFVG